MDFKSKFRKFMKEVIGDTTGITWKDLDHKKVYAAIAALVAVVVLVVALILILVSGGKEQKAEDQKNPSDVMQESEDQNTEESENENGETAEENPLEVNAYAEINDLVFKYYYARATGDIAMYEEVVDVLTEEEIKTIERKNEYIVAYHDLTCYTKKGLEENAYVVFVTYNMELHNIQTYAPGSEALYVYIDAAGDWKAFNDDISEELLNYVTELSNGEDVRAILNDVQDEFSKAVAQNEELSQFIQTLENAQQEEAEEPVTEDEEETTEDSNDESTTETSEEGTAVNKQMQLKDTVRIRADRSTDSDRVATGYKMEFVTVLENYSDGWSKIDYNGTVGYCMTEFLQEPQ